MDNFISFFCHGSQTFLYYLGQYNGVYCQIMVNLQFGFKFNEICNKLSKNITEMSGFLILAMSQVQVS